MTGGLDALRPEPLAWFRQARARAVRQNDPELVAMIELRVAQLIGIETGEPATEKLAQLRAYPASPLFTDAEREVVAFVEQFVMDVSAAHAVDADFVRTVFVCEFTLRLERTAAALLDAHPPAARPAVPDGTIKELLDGFQASVVRASSLDPVTAELVRLRCARTHHCRICQTLRLGAARAAGADDEMTAKIDLYERSDLPVRAKVALRITDALITGVGPLPESLRHDAREHFTQDELASLCVEIVKWSTQKIHVALGTDGAERLAVDAGGIAVFDFTADGAPVLPVAAAAR